MRLGLGVPIDDSRVIVNEARVKEEARGSGPRPGVGIGLSMFSTTSLMQGARTQRGNSQPNDGEVPAAVEQAANAPLRGMVWHGPWYGMCNKYSIGWGR